QKLIYSVADNNENVFSNFQNTDSLDQDLPEIEGTEIIEYVEAPSPVSSYFEVGIKSILKWEGTGIQKRKKNLIGAEFEYYYSRDGNFTMKGFFIKDDEIKLASIDINLGSSWYSLAPVPLFLGYRSLEVANPTKNNDLKNNDLKIKAPVLGTFYRTNHPDNKGFYAS
ncbi:hypothetical protein THIOM_003984, partial [Candidatus Thiomargarita nelsonii]